MGRRVWAGRQAQVLLMEAGQVAPALSNNNCHSSRRGYVVRPAVQRTLTTVTPHQASESGGLERGADARES